ncbi:MAG: hypothetical protein LBL52_03730 [Rickettsiales bacterium]|jgi:hypothetical protein|nr:hypothetical protein [Rickettsiales bacterium]
MKIHYGEKNYIERGRLMDLIRATKASDGRARAENLDKAFAVMLDNGIWTKRAWGTYMYLVGERQKLLAM